MIIVLTLLSVEQKYTSKARAVIVIMVNSLSYIRIITFAHESIIYIFDSVENWLCEYDSDIVVTRLLRNASFTQMSHL